MAAWNHLTRCRRVSGPAHPIPRVSAQIFHRGFHLPTLLCIGLALTMASAAMAQRRSQPSARRYQVGDAIEYLWVNQWMPGQVLAVERNRVGIEYDWNGTLRREVVTPDKLRFEWEGRALTPMRTWKDESGSFSIRAAAVALDLDAGQVTLHKVDDGEVTVPIEKLSEADRRLLDQAGALSVPELPPVTPFAQSSGIGSAAWGSADNLAEVAPDPPPALAALPMAGVVIPAADFFEEIVGLMPIGGSSGWMLAGTKASQSVPGRLLWVTLADQKLQKQQLLPPGEALVAVDPANRQVLTAGVDEDDQTTLTVWQADPTAKRAQPRVRWTSFHSRGGVQRSWAALLSADRVLHQWADRGYVVWDVASQREVYRIDQESFFHAKPVLSPGMRYLALPEDKRVRILEAATGRTLASLPIEGGSAAGVGFDRQGEQLAVLTRSNLAVWRLGSADPPQRLRADAVGTPFSAAVDWVDDRSLLIGRETLFDLQLELPVWTYKQAHGEVQSDHFGQRTLSVVDGKLCYVVVIRSGQQKTLIVGAVDLPGPAVRETVAQVNPEDLFLLKPGGRVRLEVDCGQYNSQVQAAITRLMQDNGWVLDSNASLTVRAEMGRGETQTVEYTSQGGGGSQSASVTPYFSRLKVMQGDTVAWQSGTSSGLPSVMFLKPGESAQSRANEMQKPNPDFFQNAKIPPKIFDPAFRNGFGTSTISSKGLVPGAVRTPRPAAG